MLAHISLTYIELDMMHRYWSLST